VLGIATIPRAKLDSRSGKREQCKIDFGEYLRRSLSLPVRVRANNGRLPAEAYLPIPRLITLFQSSSCSPTAWRKGGGVLNQMIVFC
jgi:hypothetical protein